MFEIKNTSPFAVETAITPDKDGREVLLLVVKASFSMTKQLRIAEEQRPVTLADEYWEEPDASSLKYASDIVLSKPGTDVAVVGQAWAPDGGEVRVMDTLLSVGDYEKIVRVHGDRWFVRGLTGLTMTKPEPYRSIPLVWERAFGGRCVVNEEKQKLVSEEYNPVGLGLKAKEKGETHNGQPAPNLEDPSRPFGGLTRNGTPANYGFIAPWWLPRRSYAGTYDDTWKNNRMPLLPEDFDERFFIAASPDLFYEPYLEGGEPVSLVNMHPDGPLEFNLPRCKLNVDIEISGEKQQPPLCCHTVLFEPDDNIMSMTWHTSVFTGNSPHNIGEINVALEKLEGVED